MTAITVNGNSYCDDGSTAGDMQNGGFWIYLLKMLGDIMIDSSSKLGDCTNQAAIATTQAAAAIAAAASTVTGPGSTGTSTTSLTVGMGSKSLTIQAGKTLYVGMPIVIAASSSPLDAMYGTLTSYNSGTGAMVVQVTNILTGTAGVYITAAAWTISLTGPAGTTGVLNELKGAAVASASTVNLDSVTGNLLHLAGSVTVNAITLAQGAERVVIVDAAPTLTHGSNLDCPGGASIVCAAGDRFTVRGDGAGKVYITNYVRADGSLLAGAGASTAEAKSGTSTAKALTPASALAAQGFTAYAQTADQTITNGGLLTIAHGLGRVPVLITGHIKNINPEFAWSAGDVTVFPIGAQHGSAGLAAWSDATNIYVRFSNYGLQIIYKDGAGVATLSSSNWKLFLRAWA